MLMKAMTKSALTSLVILIASVTGLSQSNEARRQRIIPIRPMSQDVEVLYGDPEAVGEPFVMRIRELAGGIPSTSTSQCCKVRCISAWARSLTARR